MKMLITSMATIVLMATPVSSLIAAQQGMASGAGQTEEMKDQGTQGMSSEEAKKEAESKMQQKREQEQEQEREQDQTMNGQGERSMEQQREMEQQRDQEQTMDSQADGSMEQQREMEQKEQGKGAEEGEKKKERKWWRFWE